MREIRYVFACIISVIVVIFVMKFLGVTVADVKDFIINGIGGGLKFLLQFKGIYHWPS